MRFCKSPLRWSPCALDQPLLSPAALPLWSLGLVWVLLLLYLYNNFAPWERAYRNQALAVMRTELAALPPIASEGDPTPLERGD